MIEFVVVRSVAVFHGPLVKSGLGSFTNHFFRRFGLWNQSVPGSKAPLRKRYSEMWPGGHWFLLHKIQRRCKWMPAVEEAVESKKEFIQENIELVVLEGHWSQSFGFQWRNRFHWEVQLLAVPTLGAVIYLPVKVPTMFLGFRKTVPFCPSLYVSGGFQEGWCGPSWQEDPAGGSAVSPAAGCPPGSAGLSAGPGTRIQIW